MAIMAITFTCQWATALANPQQLLCNAKKTDLFHIPGADKTQEISEIGYFELPDNCLARYKSTILRPATRNLEILHEKIRPTIKLQAQPLAQFKDFIQKSKQTLSRHIFPQKFGTHMFCH